MGSLGMKLARRFGLGLGLRRVQGRSFSRAYFLHKERVAR